MGSDFSFHSDFNTKSHKCSMLGLKLKRMISDFTCVKSVPSVSRRAKSSAFNGKKKLKCLCNRLAQERQEAAEQHHRQPAAEDNVQKLLDSLSKSGVDNFTMKAAVPGTEIPGHKVQLYCFSHHACV